MQGHYKPTLFIFFVVMMLACQSPKQEESKEVAEEANDDHIDNKQHEKDAQFIVDAVSLNYDEIKLAQLAQTKSNSEEIKSMAQMLEKEHLSQLMDLKGLATEKGISIPIEESNNARKQVEELSEESVSDFDRQWTKELIDCHEKGISKFKKAISDAADPEIQAFANSNVGKLQAHLEALKTFQDKIR
jgi:putative membrane protein